MLKIILLLLLLTLPLAACQQQEQPTTPPQSREEQAQKTVPPSANLQLSAPVQLLELPIDALPLWRAQQQPALVIFAETPLLQEIPAALQTEALELIKTGNQEQVSRHGSLKRVKPLILPEQTLRAASAAGLFSAIYWVYPSKVAADQIDVELFRKQLIDRKQLSTQEAQSLELHGDLISGRVNNIPLYIVHPQRLPEIAVPLLLHIDLSYLQGRYKNAVETPLYSLLHETAVQLQLTGWQPAAVSISASTINGTVPLENRFLLENLRDLLMQPENLKQMPEAWEKRSEALYGAEIFSAGKILELYSTALKLSPENASALYDLFQTHFLAGNHTAAILALDRAVSLDPGYGAAYLQLAQLAREDNQPERALEQLNKAAVIFPLNPFILLQKSLVLLQLNRPQETARLLDTAMAEPWSSVHHPEVPQLLKELQQSAQQQAQK